MKKALSSGGTVNIMGENITTQEQLDQKSVVEMRIVGNSLVSEESVSLGTIRLIK